MDKKTFDNYMRGFHYTCPDSFYFVGLFAHVYGYEYAAGDAHDIKIAVYVQYSRKDSLDVHVCPEVFVDSIAEALPLLKQLTMSGDLEWPEK